MADLPRRQTVGQCEKGEAVCGEWSWRRVAPPGGLAYSSNGPLSGLVCTCSLDSQKIGTTGLGPYPGKRWQMCSAKLGLEGCSQRDAVGRNQRFEARTFLNRSSGARSSVCGALHRGVMQAFW